MPTLVQFWPPDRGLTIIGTENRSKVGWASEETTTNSLFMETGVEVVDGSSGVAERSGDPLEGVGVRSEPSSIAFVECIDGRDLLSRKLKVEHVTPRATSCF